MVLEEDVSITHALWSNKQNLRDAFQRRLPSRSPWQGGRRAAKPSIIMSSDPKAVITRGELFALTRDVKTENFPLSGI